MFKNLCTAVHMHGQLAPNFTEKHLVYRILANYAHWIRNGSDAQIRKCQIHDDLIPFTTSQLPVSHVRTCNIIFEFT